MSYSGPPRGGTRGGADQFSWDQVKTDKDRDHYLGHSIHASVGRYNKGRDILWYTRGKGQDAADQKAAELQAIKDHEDDLMREALGLAPKRERVVQAAGLEQHELKELLKRGADREDEEPAPSEDADRIKGVGYRPLGLPQGDGRESREIVAGVGVGAGPGERARGSVGASAGAGSGERKRRAQSPSTSEERKRAKKERKAEKKEAKRARKEEKRRRRSRSRSRSRSPS
mmetsp:Transcript_20090/g.65442  ORF Transcript_20090/g.65442 Transcript_20090/m.65442 type:complete len:229 (+) Transcript_20090:67-753(+)